MSLTPDQRASLIARLRQMAANLRRDDVVIDDPDVLAVNFDDAANEIESLGNFKEGALKEAEVD